MTSPARRLFALVLFLATFALSGCTTFNEHASTVIHNLKPHRLWRLNRHPAPRRDVYYSVSDPIPELKSPTHALDLDSTDQSITFDVDAPLH